MAKTRVSLRDVARSIGVHHTTVSLALRNHPSLPKATRTRIRFQARKLGYRPNPLVSALMSHRISASGKRSYVTLAYIDTVVSDFDSKSILYFRDLQLGAQARARELGYHFEMFRTGHECLPLSQVDLILRTRNIHGLLIGPRPLGMSNLELDLAERAAVTFGVSLREPKVDRVSNDQYLSIRLAFEHCRQEGYRRIGFMMVSTTSQRVEHRYLAGFQVEQFFLPQAEQVQPFIYNIEEAPQKLSSEIQDWLSTEKPDAVLCHMYQGTIPGLDLLNRFRGGVKIAVLDLIDPHSGTPGIYQNPRQLGAVGADLLIAKLQKCEYGPSEVTRSYSVCGNWVDGKPKASRRHS